MKSEKYSSAQVLPSYYLPPISWFVRLLESDEPILVEQWANYKKQTLHNRCWIDSPNGPLALTIPVDRSTFVKGKCLMKDVLISDHSDWQKQHWYALESSYYNSPFFEYLQDDFHPIYNKRWKWLMDLNEELILKCIELITFQRSQRPHPQPLPEGGKGVTWTSMDGKEHVIARTTQFVPSPSACPPPWGDWGLPYYQVFSHKHGFLPDLSIIDLIFNLGPESALYLHNLTNAND